MVHLLAEVRPPNAILQSVYARIFSASVPCLILNKLNRLEFLALSVDGLELIDTLTIEDPIVCMGKFKHGKLATDIVLLLTESNVLLFLWYDAAVRNFVILHSIEFDGSNQKSPVDSCPKIVVDPSPQPKFFLVFFFEGFIQAFTINHQWSTQTTPSGRSKRKLHKDELVKEFTFSIGAITTQDVDILKGFDQDSNKRTIAILYRDYNFNYSFRYYQFGLKDKKFVLVKQFEEFEDAPTTMITPPAGGVLILSDSYFFYFPSPEIKLLDLSEHNSDSSISCSSAKLTITKKLSTSDDGEVSAFHCNTIIDKNRILLIDNKGVSFMLFIDLGKKSSTSLMLSSLSLINLGFSTIPTAVHHIHEGLFFVTSKFSQSVLFQISPKQPYIQVTKFLASSPPVLDIQASPGVPNSLLLCQGGYDSGEFRKLSSKRFYLEFVKSFQASVQGQSISYVGEDGDSSVLRVYNKDQQQIFSLNDKKYGLSKAQESNKLLFLQNGQSSLEMTEKDVRMNGVIVNELPVTKCKALSENEFVILDNQNTLHVYSEVLLHSIKLQTNEEVSGIDFIRTFGQEYLMLVCFWNGSSELYLFSPSEQECVISEQLGLGGVPITSCCLKYNSAAPSSVWLLFITSNNDLVQINVDFRRNKKDHYKTNCVHLEGSPYKFAGTGSYTIVFNKSHVFSLHTDATIDFNKLSELELELDSNLDFIDMELFDNKIACLCNNEEIFIYSIDPMKPTNDVVFSNCLNNKCVVFGDTAIVLKSSNVFVESSGEFTRNSFFEMVDLKSMQPINTFTFPNAEPIEVMGICVLNTENLSVGFDDDGSVHFVAVCNSEELDNLLMVFEVKANEIHRLGKCKVRGIINASKLEPYSIKPLDKESNSYIISGSMNFIAKPVSLIDWSVNSDSVYPSAVYSVSSAVVGDTIVLADVMTGITTTKMVQKSDGSYTMDRGTVSQYLQATFLTGVTGIEYEEGDMILVSDLTGNLLGLCSLSDDEGHNESQPFEEVISFNIGDPINVLTKLPKAIQPKDFSSHLDGFKQPEPLLLPKAVMGTVNGAIYTLNELVDVDEELQDIIASCCEEIIQYKTSVSDIYQVNKRDKLARNNIRKGRKLLQQDENGNFIRTDPLGTLDLSLVQNWLERDTSINKRHTGDNEELMNMKKNLKTCYKNRSLLERLVFEAQYI